MTKLCVPIYVWGMNPAIHFLELENRVILATYRSLMIGAKVQLIDNANGEALSEPVTKITSPIPSGSLRISLPVSITAGTYFLRALDGHGQPAAQSAVFDVR